MRRKASLLSTIMLLSTLWSWGQVQQKSFDVLLKTMLSGSVPQITVPNLAQKDLSSLLLLDAREKKEYQVSHIPGAKWVGYETFDPSVMKGIKKDAEIIIYCSIGVRSEKIGEQLQTMGYTHVKNLYGSIFEWVNQGNPLENMKGKATDQIHAYNKVWGLWLTEGKKVYE